MAYGSKYRFKWESQNGVDYQILIQKNNYSGAVIDRRLGRAPVLKRKHSGRVYGTSLEFYAECSMDGEFTELYTSNAREYQVVLSRGDSVIWTGFVSPELYSEPDIAPPYDVQIVATDGLGELKQYTFEAQGEKSLGQLFSYLLGLTGGTGNINRISALTAKLSNGGTISEYNFWNTAWINIDYKEGEKCYDVLQYLLSTLCASITYTNNGWLIWRDNDISSDNSAPVAIGSLLNSGVWPIGQLSSKIVPAKRQVAVEAPFHRWTNLENPEMKSDSGWTKLSDGQGNTATYDSAAKAYLSTIYGAGIQQELSNTDVAQGFQLETTLVASGHSAPSGIDTWSEKSGIYIQVSFNNGTQWGLLDMNDGNGPLWKTNSELTPQQQQEFAGKWGLLVNVGAQGSAANNVLSIPPFGRTGGTTGLLTISINPPSYSYIFNCYLYKPVSKGYRDILKIDNGARGEGDTVEIAHGRVLSSMVGTYFGYLRGVLCYSTDKFVTGFADNVSTSYGDLLALTARNYARLVALPRLRITGKLNTPGSDFTRPPMLLSKGGIVYLLETYSWDMLNDELEIDALSLPSGILTIESETVIDTTGESATTSGSSGGGGGSSSGGTNVEWGTTPATGFQQLKVNGDANHVVALSGHGHTMAQVEELSNALAAKQNVLTFDDAPTAESDNPVKSGGIYTALQGKADSTHSHSINQVVGLQNALNDKASSLHAHDIEDVDDLQEILDGKQDALTFDDAPTANSNNPVKSKGIKTALDGKSNTGHSHVITDVSGLQNALNNKQNILTFDSTPTSGSLNPVTSDGIYQALAGDSPLIDTLSAPSLEIMRQVQLTTGQVADPQFILRHPLLARNNVSVVLMVWSGRRAREGYQRYIKYRTGWGEARGGTRTAVAPTWYNATNAKKDYISIPLDSVRLWILQNYICGWSQHDYDVRQMSLANFRGGTAEDFRFGAKFYPQPSGWTKDIWKAHTKSSRLFGFAIRYNNPQFLWALIDGHDLVDSTRELTDPNNANRKLKRYIYTEVVPFRVFCGMGPASPAYADMKWELGVRLEDGLPGGSGRR